MNLLFILIACGETEPAPVETPEPLSVQWAEFACESQGTVLDLPSHAEVLSVSGCALSDDTFSTTCQSTSAYLVASYEAEYVTRWVKCTAQSTTFRVEWVE